jgi:hypothetical protein
MSDRAWRILFVVAALFNFAAGLPPLLVPADAVANFGLPPSNNYLFVQLTGALVTVFGLGYLMVARDLSQRGIVWMGAIGKALVVVLAVLYKMNGKMPDLAFALSVGDLIFVLAFLVFLLTKRRSYL